MLYRLDLPLEAFYPANRGLSRRGNFILPRRERPLLAGKKRLRVSAVARVIKVGGHASAEGASR